MARELQWKQTWRCQSKFVLVSKVQWVSRCSFSNLRERSSPVKLGHSLGCRWQEVVGEMDVPDLLSIALLMQCAAICCVFTTAFTYYSCSSFWKWVLAGHGNRCCAGSVFTGSQNAVTAQDAEVLCTLWDECHSTISSSWENTRVPSAGEMKYLAPKSPWGTAGSQRDVELCSQHGSALAPSISHLPLRASCFTFSWNVSGLGGKHGFFFIAQSSCDFSGQKIEGSCSYPCL